MSKNNSEENRIAVLATELCRASIVYRGAHACEIRAAGSLCSYRSWLTAIAESGRARAEVADVELRLLDELVRSGRLSAEELDEPSPAPHRLRVAEQATLALVRDREGAKEEIEE